VLPGPAAVDAQLEPSSAADQAGGDVQDAVAQRLGFGSGELAVEQQ